MTSLDTNPHEPGPSASLHTPTHSANPSLSSSTRSYAPVLINPPSSDYPLPTPEAPFLTLKYPYPLPIASLFDLAYTIHYQYHSSHTGWTGHLIAGAIARGVVLIGVVGSSKRWRSRGGWVAAICGISVGGGIWEDCVERLGAGSGSGGQGKRQGRQSWFLYMTILICISEYLLYLLLLRLSPPSHRGSTNPFSLRRPLPPVQTDVPFQFDSEDLEYTPRSVRYRRYSREHNRSRSGTGLGPGLFESQPTTLAGPSRLRRESNSNHTDTHLSAQAYADHNQEEDEEEEADEEESEDEDSESNFSSFSESSIIDLPPPLSPQRIIPPSISMNSGLNLGGQPILRGIVRRTRSARYLGMSRSWGSAVERMEGGLSGQREERGTERETEMGGSVGSGEGYGTFETSARI